MHFTVPKLTVLLSVVVLTTSQYDPFQRFNKFRPSPLDATSYDMKIYNYRPVEYELKAPSYNPPVTYQDYTYPQQQIYNAQQQIYNTQQPFQKPLFTPAQEQYPAETSGQMQNYQQALREEAEEKRRQQQQYYSDPTVFGKNYVDVKFGGLNNLRYQYTY